MERACQNRAQEVCERLTGDYESKVAALQRQLAAAQNEIGGLRADREQFEERMKKGFMRGVCALNLEAMTMFREGEEDSKENVEPVQPFQVSTLTLTACHLVHVVLFTNLQSFRVSRYSPNIRCPT